MKTLKGLEWPERRRRNHLILETFERHEAENLPWMARTSGNDPDVIIEITDKLREPVGVYTWFGEGDWLSVSVNQISQSINGKYEFIEFGKGKIQTIEKDDGLIINGILFKSPPDLINIYANLVQELENIANK